MHSDSDIGNFSLMGLLGSAVGRVKGLGRLMPDGQHEQTLLTEQPKSDVHEAKSAGVSADAPTAASRCVVPAAGHRGVAFFGTIKRTSSRPIAAVQTPRPIYTDADVRRRVFDEENGPERMRALAQTEKDLLAFRDREHAMEACLTAGRLAPEPMDDSALRQKCAELRDMLPAAAEAYDAEMRRFHEEVDERYQVPTTRAAVGWLVEECTLAADSGLVDAFSAAPGAGERYRKACAELKDALEKVDVAVQQNRERNAAAEKSYRALAQAARQMEPLRQR
jgi:hypothetical protein